MKGFGLWEFAAWGVLTLTISACTGGSGGTTRPTGDPPTVQLLSPTSGDVSGQTLTITWTSEGDPSVVDVAISDDSGATFDALAATGLPDTGSADVDVSSLPDGSTYRVRLTPVETGSLGTPATMDADFSIDRTTPIVTITNPVGGEVLHGIQEIRWLTTDDNPDTVDVLLSDDSGASFDVVLAEGIEDVGTLTFDTSDYDNGRTFRLRVVARDAAGNASTPVDLGQDLEIDHVPCLERARFYDANSSGTTNEGDRLVLDFSRPIAISGLTAASLELPVTSDSLGTSPTFAVESETQLVITLGASPVLKARQLFSESNVAANSASALDLAGDLASGAITNANTDHDATSSGPVDLEPALEPRATLGDGASTLFLVADFDRDGDLDVIRGVADANTELWTSNGSGELTLSTDLLDAATFGTYADFDRDGDLDLLLGQDGLAGSKLWINDGAGSFSDSGQTLNPSAARAVATADLDKDGDLDLAFGNADEGNTVWINDGTGTFTDSSQRLGDAQTVAIHAADFDRDGDNDLFATNRFASHRLWLNNGAGTFSDSGQSFPASDAQGSAIADLDGRSGLDIVLANRASHDILSNDGTGILARTSALDDGPSFTGVAIDDLDRNGAPDIVLVRSSGAQLIRYGIGDGTFSADTASTDGGIRTIALADLDRDGDPDVLSDVAAGDGFQVEVSALSASRGSTSFELHQTLSASDCYSIAAGDLDGDGDIDVVTGLLLADSRVFLNDGTGTLIAGQTLTRADALGSVLFDADSDGDLDLFQAGYRQQSRMLENDGSASFTVVGTMPSLDVVSASAGDFDRDGDLDLFRSIWDSTPNELWLNDGSGSFTDSGQSLGSESSLRAMAGDLDRDGDLDVIVAGDSAHPTLPYLNNGSGTFTAGTGFASSGRRWTPCLLDVDRDGDLDVVVTTTDGNLTIWVNDGSSGFSDSGVTISTGSALDACTADLNGDGILDILLADQSGLSDILLGDGAGSFGAASSPADSGPARSCRSADIDNDGDMDLLIGANSSLLVFLNK